jgi:hypothetical protein
MKIDLRNSSTSNNREIGLENEAGPSTHCLPEDLAPLAKLNPAKIARVIRAATDACVAFVF